jgi:hypothetical protein
MKKVLQFIGFVIIVIGGFWVGMQWGSLGNSSVPPVEYQHTAPISPVTTPTDTAPTTVSSEVTTPVQPTQTTPVPTGPTATSPVTTSGTVDIPTPKNDKVVHYQSNYFKYGFDIPASVYYSAFGGQDGAQHTVAIAKEIPEALSDGAVRVYFYGKKIVSELQNAHANKYEDPAGKFIYLLLNGQYSVKIEANDINNPIVQKIVQTIAVSQ